MEHWDAIPRAGDSGTPAAEPTDATGSASLARMDDGGGELVRKLGNRDELFIAADSLHTRCAVARSRAVLGPRDPEVWITGAGGLVAGHSDERDRPVSL